MYVEGEGAQERQARSSLNASVYQLLLRHLKTTFARTVVTMFHLLALGILTVHAFLLRYSFGPILILNALKSFLVAYMALVSMQSIFSIFDDYGESTKRRACFTGVNKIPYSGTSDNILSSRSVVATIRESIKVRKYVIWWNSNHRRSL